MTLFYVFRMHQAQIRQMESMFGAPFGIDRHAMPAIAGGRGGKPHTQYVSLAFFGIFLT